MNNVKAILVTGATGYVSGRLIPLLLAEGYKVKAMGRSIPKMADRPWGQDQNVELVKGDIQDIESLKNAAKGCGTVYYLVHSMISQKGKYRDADKIGAMNMVQAFSCGYQSIVEGTPSILWKSIEKIGGRTGYYGADKLWKIRGFIDTFAGGVGLSGNRRANKVLKVGDTVDFWKVLEMVPESKLLLLSEMKAPGQALLEFRIENMDNGQCQIVLLSRFLPKGLIGLSYWYVLYPFHQYVFIKMLKGLVNASGLKMVTQPEKYYPLPSDICRWSNK